ncbi:MAG TPA: carboxypeptidase-like regulatory domain-containing protein, partial [Pyrinomonadaceae bacterium]|nr:carboxypeptidase-like regulatory domain-containing protein [Pyrinomonadaceae bacterium]
MFSPQTLFRSLRAAAACAFLLCACATGATAQTVTGTIQGTVTDPNGDVVPGATVQIRNVETGQERTVETNG